VLKGFSRIHLHPSERRTVTFLVPQDQLAIWNGEQRWVVEPGSYTVWAGGSSEASLTAKFNLKP
jgi:beta-glucosidase